MEDSDHGVRARIGSDPLLRARPWVPLVLLVLVSCGARTEVGPDPVAEVRKQALAAVSRIGIIGASVSAGYGNDLPLEVPLRLGLEVPTEIHSYASSAFFVYAKGLGSGQVAGLLTFDPTLVFAIDFLFWYGYGKKSLERRMEDLERALALLDRFDVPVLVGDFPDMSGASPLMLPRSKIPSPEELAVLNERVAEWARERPRVHLVPLSGWLGRLRAGETLTVGDRGIEAESFFAWDRLHPSREGQIHVAILLLERIRSLYPGLAASEVIQDVDVLGERVRKALQKKR